MASIPETRQKYQHKVAEWKAQLDRHAPESESFWELVAERFPNPRYFGTGSIGLCPDLVVQAVADYTAAAEGWTWYHDYWPWHEETIRNVADFAGADPHEIGLVENTTVGMNLLANGLRVPTGSKVVTNDFEHVSGRLPWHRYDPRTDKPVYQVSTASIPVEGATGQRAAEAILEAVDGATKVVQFSQVDRYRGLRYPVEAIVSGVRQRAPEAFIALDGAQSMGILPVDLHAMGCDAFACGFHKWGFGPKGTGLLYLREQAQDRVLSSLSHTFDGPVKVSEVSKHLTFSSAINWSARFALEVALDLQRAIGRERIIQRALALADRLRAGLAAIPDLIIYSPADPAARTSIVSFSTPAAQADPGFFGRLQDRARQAGLLIYPDGIPGRGSCLRIPCHVYNTPTAIDDLLTVVVEGFLET